MSLDKTAQALASGATLATGRGKKKPAKKSRAVRGRSAATFVRALKRNADAYHAGRITYEQHGARNLEIWRAIEKSPRLKASVLTALRQKPPTLTKRHATTVRHLPKSAPSSGPRGRLGLRWTKAPSGNYFVFPARRYRDEWMIEVTRELHEPGWHWRVVRDDPMGGAGERFDHGHELSLRLAKYRAAAALKNALRT